MGRAPQIGELNEEGKVVVSLGVRAWLGVIVSVALTTIFVFWHVTTVARHNTAIAADSLGEISQNKAISDLNRLKWRISRLEEKTGIARRERRDRRERDREDD